MSTATATPTRTETKTQPQSIDPRSRRASRKRQAHQQAFATGRGSKSATAPERERPQRKLTPQERAQAAATEAQRKLQQSELESNRVRGELRRMQEQLEAAKSAHSGTCGGTNPVSGTNWRKSALATEASRKGNWP